MLAPLGSPGWRGGLGSAWCWRACVGVVCPTVRGHPVVKGVLGRKFLAVGRSAHGGRQEVSAALDNTPLRTMRRPPRPPFNRDAGGCFVRTPAACSGGAGAPPGRKVGDRPGCAPEGLRTALRARGRCRSCPGMRRFVRVAAVLLRDGVFPSLTEGKHLRFSKVVPREGWISSLDPGGSRSPLHRSCVTRCNSLSNYRNAALVPRSCELPLGHLTRNCLCVRARTLCGRVTSPRMGTFADVFRRSSAVGCRAKQQVGQPTRAAALACQRGT